MDRVMIRFGSRTWYFLGTPGWGAPSHIDQVPIMEIKTFDPFSFEHTFWIKEFSQL